MSTTPQPRPDVLAIPPYSRYPLGWRDYSRVSGSRGQFRALLLEVTA